MTKRIHCDLHVVLSFIPCHWFNDWRKKIIHILFNSLIAVRTWTVIGIQNCGLNEYPTQKVFINTNFCHFRWLRKLISEAANSALFFMFLCFMLQWREKQI